MALMTLFSLIAVYFISPRIGTDLHGFCTCYARAILRVVYIWPSPTTRAK